MKYSASTRGFYTGGQAAPEDAVDLSHEEWEALLAAQSVGHQIVPDENGHPVLVDPADSVSLDDFKTRLRAAVDAAAEVERAKHITGGAGQAMTYQQKASEAVMLEDDPSPDPASYPMLSAEVGITAATLAEVGAVVRQAHASWIVLGAQIEGVRLGAKKAIGAATDAEAARAAAVVIWPGGA
ncbi:hypothetical protein [Ancylobacter sp. SL191]|uniref:hypothetical protein n=1 Tax=Ancylobacter sp. SL191 TaxID=2995166 RepID=UPI00226F58B0|nr:hypothetical protein [Ancylobacter sp. SL191]WAC26442.1 hypothetical protein OU996_15655 [Ancylobacter sp. SL191]